MTLNPTKSDLLNRSGVRFILVILGGTSVSDKTVFYVELICLWALAVSWMVASKLVPELKESEVVEAGLDAKLAND